METKFQTSFIPKKSFIPVENPHPHSGSSFFMIFAMIIFIASISGAAFMFVAKTLLIRAQEQSKIDLKESEKRFDVALIEDLKKANIKIDLATHLLENHAAVSETFKIIGGLTAERVRFTSLSFTAPDFSSNSGSANTQNFKINMKGIANSFNTVAFQSDVLGSSREYGTNKVIKNPILSDLAVDTNGNVSFNFSAELSLPDISYKKGLSAITSVDPEQEIPAPGN
jgi:hypothetical protein